MSKNISKIEEIDKNFFVDENVDINAFDLYNSVDKPIKVYGLILPDENNDRFKRMPTDVAAAVSANSISDGVLVQHANTAGGRVRFKTNSSKIAIFVKMDRIGRMAHFALAGSAGFDLYVNNEYSGTFIPPYKMEEGYSSVKALLNNDEKDITINFPLYSDVISLFIGIEKGATISESEEYTIEKPIVYYGSSITQGGCASRPGNAYQAIISRRLDCNFINLGFSGAARGEIEMANYVSELDMSAFVYDYDHNASLEMLEKTHKRMFDVIREKHPELPVIMVSRPKIVFDDDTRKRLEIITNTYNIAIQNGDKNVYLIDGGAMMREFADECATVDGCHPNDHGFVAMAKKIGNVLEMILRK